MNLHNAVLMAAETIRINPELFNFWAIKKPDPCGTPGCAIGWINYYANAPDNYFTHVTDIFYNDTDSEDLFYDEMDLVCGSDFWMEDADECSETLLKWAEKHEEKLKALEIKNV